MKKLARLSFGALLAAWVVACIPNVQQPDVRLAGVRLGGLGLEGGTLFVRLSVVNPNRFALEAGELNYDLKLKEPVGDGEEWVDAARGTFDKTIRVDAHDSTTVEIPVKFSYRGLGGALRSVLRTGTVDYRVDGTILLAEPVAAEFPYHHSGTVAIAENR